MDLNLKHFSPREFGIWWPSMNSDQLLKLDHFAALLAAAIPGAHVMISPSLGALGRPANIGSNGGSSMHNVTKWGTVRASDVMPYVVEPDGSKRSLSPWEIRKAVELAAQAGFGGIGVYPDWQPFAGMHLDNRQRINGHIARWGMMLDANGVQVEVAQATALQAWRA